MKKVLLPLFLGSSLALVACGGSDSGSSGEQAPTPTPNEQQQETPKEQTQSNKCVKNGDTVEVTTSGCTYAIANLNGGAEQTYKCSGGRVTSSLGISSKTINVNGLTFKCK